MTGLSLCRLSRIAGPALMLALLLPLSAGAQIDGDGAQTAPDDLAPAAGYSDEDDKDFELSEVVTRAQQAGFTPLAAETPDISFNAGDIDALGVTDMGELLDAIAAETSGNSDAPPILLLDGRPVANRREIRKFPSEAVRRVDVLAPEAALKYSSDPDRRVINFILRKRFNAVTVEGEIGTTTEGGRDTGEAGANYLRIRNKTRIALSGELSSKARLTEAQRDIDDRNAGRLFALGGNIEGEDGGEIDPALSALAGQTVTAAGVPGTANPALADFADAANTPFLEDQRRFRDLRPDEETLVLGASLFRPVGEHLSISGALNADLTQSVSKRGVRNSSFDIPATNPFSPFQNDVTLYRSEGPIIRDNDKRDIDANLSLFGDYAKTRWQIEASYNRIDDVRDTDRSLDRPAIDAVQDDITSGDPDVNPFVPIGLTRKSVSERTADTFGLKTRLNGQLYRLPAGPVTGSVGLEYTDTTLDSVAEFIGERAANSLSRRSSEARAQISIPLTGTGNAREAGYTALRLSGSADNISDFGTLKSYGAGLNWRVTDKLELQASRDIRERAPSLSQLGDPVLIDPNVRLTDFETGSEVFVDRIIGGNADLRSETRRDFQLTARYRHSRDFRINTRYRSRVTNDDITSFPFLTPQVAQAFPDRLTRDDDGALTLLDARPVNAHRTQVDSLRTGLNLTRRFARARPEPQTGASQAAPTNRPGRRRGRGRSDRVSLSLYHTWRLTEDFQFRDGGPVFDLLDGAALRRRGGEAEHEVEARVSFRRKNYGGRIEINHETGSRIATDSLGASQGRGGDITFDPLTTADLRLYYDLGRLPSGKRVKRGDWRRDLRVSLNVDNITDSKQSVQNAQGVTPFGYEPDALDPEGRTVMLSVRKMFMQRGERRSGGG